MKKAKFLIGTLVLSAALLGTGYAIWTDNLAVVNTVSTGDLEVAYSTIERYDGYAQLGDSYADLKTNEGKKLTKTKVTAKIVDDNKGLELDVSKLAPGTLGVVEVNIKNTGTLAALLDSIELDTKGMPELLRDNMVINIWVTDNEGKEIKFGDVGGTGFNPLPDMQGKLDNFFQSPNTKRTIHLLNDEGDKDKGMKLTIQVGMRQDASNELQQDEQGPHDGKLGIKLNWAQYNK